MNTNSSTRIELSGEGSGNGANRLNESEGGTSLETIHGFLVGCRSGNLPDKSTVYRKGSNLSIEEGKHKLANHEQTSPFTLRDTYRRIGSAPFVEHMGHQSHNGRYHHLFNDGVIACSALSVAVH